MICITGYDPKKIWHATLVSRQKKGKWLEGEEVGMDEEEKVKAQTWAVPTTSKLPKSLVALSVPTPSNAYRDEWDI